MAYKTIELQDIGTLYLYKRKGIKNMRLSISADAKIRLTLPYYVPYAAGEIFARSRISWLKEHMPVSKKCLLSGHKIGKAHKVIVSHRKINAPVVRLAGSEIRLTIPENMQIGHPKAQETAERACLRALRLQASKLLPERLNRIAEANNFTYHSMSVKQLKGRWGSCDKDRRIVINLYLMQLPWHLIDYVLLHELVHTKHLHHGEAFWREFLHHNPQAKNLKNEIKSYRPILMPG